MINPDHPIAELLVRDKRYKFDGYVFVFEALQYAHEKLGMGVAGESESLGEDFDLDDDLSAELGDELEGIVEDDQEERHVSGQELCEAIRMYAIEEYGYLAQSVLKHWGITETGDFGEIVFNLIEIRQMRKTPEDCREDFDDVYDFNDAFQTRFQFSAADPSEEPRSR